MKCFEMYITSKNPNGKVRTRTLPEVLNYADTTYQQFIQFFGECIDRVPAAENLLIPLLVQILLLVAELRIVVQHPHMTTIDRLFKGEKPERFRAFRQKTQDISRAFFVPASETWQPVAGGPPLTQPERRQVSECIAAMDQFFLIVEMKICAVLGQPWLQLLQYS